MQPPVRWAARLRRGHEWIDDMHEAELSTERERQAWLGNPAGTPRLPQKPHRRSVDAGEEPLHARNVLLARHEAGGTLKQHRGRPEHARAPERTAPSLRDRF